MEIVNQNVVDKEKIKEYKVGRMFNDMTNFEVPIGVIYNELKGKKKTRKEAEIFKDKVPLEDVLKTPTKIVGKSKAKVTPPLRTP
ncbi:hypothetical protein AMTR_s00085p00136020 [Amborella trichopoda]|uniref:Uncharacterized protein n=1 Tax=Amborella trichopoda TaxID=13333 RepID=W1P505_AMBTC|nr:hypothetical protein AMTR_s00085p00136020 [Amborella trichopoda]